jgi:hypothetical protein
VKVSSIREKFHGFFQRCVTELVMKKIKGIAKPRN